MFTKFEPLSDWVSDTLSTWSKLDIRIDISEKESVLYLANFDKTVIFDNTIVDLIHSSERMPNYMSFCNVKKLDFMNIVDHKVPCPGYTSDVEELYSVDGETLYFNYDIIGLLVYCLSNYDDLKNNTYDSHGRIDSTNSHFVNNQYLDRPILDEWINILFNILSSEYKLDCQKFNYEFILTTDIDSIYRYDINKPKKTLRLILGDLIKFQNILNVIAFFILFPLWKLVFYKFDPHNTFRSIFECNKNNTYKKYAFFIPSQSYSIYDSDYNLNDKNVKNIVENLETFDVNFGTHLNYKSYLDKEYITYQIDTFKSNISTRSISNRMHFLQFKFPETFYSLIDNRVISDFTQGFADLPGFKNGTCRKFRPYDLMKDRMLDIYIFPLILMDVTLYSKRYLNITNEDLAFKKASYYIDCCRKVGGNFCLLWHNSNLNSNFEKKLFKRIKDYAL
ncbi:hypothetical protein BCT78_04600 [Vibrio breoganii]|uniref:DUF7033 domain-containing protein n=1 Tax=Vibrio breoganii TaxID=553239 RepID=UPI000C842695|nr:hypothetical protein [Vibrio breoganii]PML38971.1 hypothetical protein BCT78_04600 [Vibrio breoganii]